MTATHEGLAIGHERAEEAADHAGQEWRDEALRAFATHAANHETFTTEDVRLANPDLPAPPDQRAWGAIARQAKHDRIVDADSWVRANSRSVHGMVVTLWRSRIYQGDQ